MFEDHFFKVDDKVMIDPFAKIILSEGRLDMDNNVNFNIEYDPEINAENFWAEMSQEEAKSLHLGSIPERPMKIARSKKCVRMPVGILFTVQTSPKAIRQLAELADDDLLRDARLVARTMDSTLEEAASHYVGWVLKATQTGIWDELLQGWNANNPKSPVDGFKFVIRRKFANQIRRLTGQNFAPTSEQYCLLLEREVQK